MKCHWLEDQLSLYGTEKKNKWQQGRHEDRKHWKRIQKKKYKDRKACGGNAKRTEAECIVRDTTTLMKRLAEAEKCQIDRGVIEPNRN